MIPQQSIFDSQWPPLSFTGSQLPVPIDGQSQQLQPPTQGLIQGPQQPIQGPQPQAQQQPFTLPSFVSPSVPQSMTIQPTYTGSGTGKLHGILMLLKSAATDDASGATTGGVTGADNAPGTPSESQQAWNKLPWANKNGEDSSTSDDD